MRRGTIVRRRRDLAPVDLKQIFLVHCGILLTFAVIARSEATKQSSLFTRPLDCFPALAMTDTYPLARSRRPFSRDQSRFFSLSRLSCSFLPLATASSSLARPRSLKYSFSGISVMPSRSTAPISLLICFLCSSSLRGRFGSWLKRLACRYSGILALISQISPPLVSA